MKKIYILTVVLLFSLFQYSCKKDAVQVIDVPVQSGAQIRFFNFGMNSPSVNFYANDIKVSATSSTTGAESTTGVTYGNTFPSGSIYTLLPAGNYTLKGQLPSTVAMDANLSIANVTANLENNKYYSFYTCGFYNAIAKTSDAFVIEDKLPAVDTSAAYIRFVNVVPNAPSTISLSLRNTTTLVETPVATAIAYKSASDFIKAPQAVYDLIIRYQISATSPATISFSSISLLKNRVYTFSTRGDINISPSGTAVNRLVLTGYINR
ncbi:MAG: DUF4397 domain-containing protein [Sphingobacteriaceae bacterium]|nr:MAG: DUF4397 domain-containing protein [Sphingobacteriaceae bacterium]